MTQEIERLVEPIARLFHETYECLAPEFSYSTRKASAVPWVQVPESNRNLMLATVRAVLQSDLLCPTVTDEDARWLREQAENLVRYEEDAQRLRRIADALTALISERDALQQALAETHNDRASLIKREGGGRQPSGDALVDLWNYATDHGEYPTFEGFVQRADELGVGEVKREGELMEALATLYASCARTTPALHDDCGTRIVTAPTVDALRMASKALNSNTETE